jgi:penicillin-binding protein 1A
MTRIEDKSGNTLEEFGTTTKQVISESDAFTMVTLMKGVIKTGTARRLNSYNIPVEKAGKTGTTNDNADGWFIGYTPELVAGTWVGCDDPFIQIYSGTAGGAEMSAPGWGIFMSKVYADKKLNLGQIKEFEKPIELSNDPIYADPTYFDRISLQGDSTIDEGNPDANEFFNTPVPPDNQPIEKIDIESEIPKNTDTVKNKKGDEKKADEKKTATPALKPADDKGNKKADKPKTSNDY